MEASKPQFAAPGPGSWQMDAGHFAKPIFGMLEEVITPAFDRGMRRSFVWPTSSKNFWSQEPAEPSIGLGRLNCFVETVGANPLAVYWQITPLFPDGDTPHVPPPRASTSWGMALTAGQVYGPYLIGLGLMLLFVVRRRR